MASISSERLAAVFVECADTLVDHFDVIEFLQQVTARTSELVDARAAGLLLADPQGRLQMMAASDERAEMIELFQAQAVEGPCQDAFRQGTAVVNVDLRVAAGLWPQFAPRAVAAGYRSVHAFPMRLRDQTVGALNLFGDETGRLDPDDAVMVQALADVATIGLMQERALRRSEMLAEQLQSALNSRIVVEQAKGAIAHIQGLTPDEAFARIRTYCRSRGLRIGEVALAITTDPGRVPELTQPPPPQP